MASMAVTLLSGGLDSTAVAAYARGRVDELTALTFDYGQTHSKEVRCAQKISQLMSIRHELVDVSFLGRVAWYSALTNPDAFPIPKGRPTKEMGVSIPITYVPLRNTLFLALAGAFVESQALHAIEVREVEPREVKVQIFLAPNAIDYSGYPDCRPEFYEKMRQTMMYGSKLWTQYGVPIQIETPVIHMAKAEIIKLGLELKAPLEYTWSCYEGGEYPCGGCDSCILRAEGFAKAGCPDPLLVRLGKG